MSAWQFEDVAPLAVEANGHLPLPLCDWTPEELAKVAAFETAPTPPEVREAAVVEEVARALYDADQAYAEETDYDFHQPVEWRYNHPAHDDFRRFAAAAVAAYRATQDGGAEEAVRRLLGLIAHDLRLHAAEWPLSEQFARRLDAVSRLATQADR